MALFQTQGKNLIETDRNSNFLVKFGIREHSLIMWGGGAMRILCFTTQIGTPPLIFQLNQISEAPFISMNKIGDASPSQLGQKFLYFIKI